MPLPAWRDRGIPRKSPRQRTREPDPVAELNSVACVSAELECTVLNGRYFTDDSRQLAIVAPGVQGHLGTALTPWPCRRIADTENPGGDKSRIRAYLPSLPGGAWPSALYRGSSGVNQVHGRPGGRGKCGSRHRRYRRPAKLAVNGASQLSSVSCVQRRQLRGRGRRLPGQAATALPCWRCGRPAATGNARSGCCLRRRPRVKANPFLSAVSCWAPGHCTVQSTLLTTTSQISRRPLAITDTNNRWARATRSPRRRPRNPTWPCSASRVTRLLWVHRCRRL